MIERRIRGGKVYEVQVGDGCGEIKGAVIKREVEPNAEELEQMECARRVEAYIKQQEIKG